MRTEWRADVHKALMSLSCTLIMLEHLGRFNLFASVISGPDRDSSAVTTSAILPRRIHSRDDCREPCAKTLVFAGLTCVGTTWRRRGVGPLQKSG